VGPGYPTGLVMAFRPETIRSDFLKHHLVPLRENTVLFA
jgi:hypothetical protein